MKHKYIYDTVRKIKKKYGDINPFELCRELGINILFISMGTADDACKGFFIKQSRIKKIVINSDLSEEFQKIICAHELGHAYLHDSKVLQFHDFALFDATTTAEYEANIFASEFLLNDDDVLETLNDDLSFFQAAAKLCVPAEILDFKFRMLKSRGYAITDSPVCSDSTWLKNARDGGMVSYY